MTLEVTNKETKLMLQLQSTIPVSTLNHVMSSVWVENLDSSSVHWLAELILRHFDLDVIFLIVEIIIVSG